MTKKTFVKFVLVDKRNGASTPTSSVCCSQIVDDKRVKAWAKSARVDVTRTYLVVGGTVVDLDRKPGSSLTFRDIKLLSGASEPMRVYMHSRTK